MRIVIADRRVPLQPPFTASRPKPCYESGGLKVNSFRGIGPAGSGKKMFLNRQHRAFGFSA